MQTQPVKRDFPSISIALMTSYCDHLEDKFEHVFFKPIQFDDLFRFIEDENGKKVTI